MHSLKAVFPGSLEEPQSSIHNILSARKAVVCPTPSSQESVEEPQVEFPEFRFGLA